MRVTELPNLTYSNTYQSDLEAKILGSASTSWPRPGLGFINLASKNMLSNVK